MNLNIYKFFIFFPIVINSLKYFKEKYYVKYSNLYYSTKLHFYLTNCVIENVYFNSYINMTELINEKSILGEYIIIDNNMIHFNYKEFIDFDSNNALAIPFFEDQQYQKFYFLNQLKSNKLIENKIIFFIPTNETSEINYYNGLSNSIEGDIYYGGIDNDIIKNRDKLTININNSELIINFNKILFEGFEDIYNIIGINNIIITPSPYNMFAPKSFIDYFNNTFLKKYYNNDSDCKSEKTTIYCKVKVVEKLPKLKIFFEKNKFLFIEIKYFFYLNTGYINSKERYLVFILKEYNKYFRFGYVIMKNNITELNIDNKQIIFYGDYINNNSYNFFKNKKNFIYITYIIIFVLNFIGILNLIIFKFLNKKNYILLLAQ